MPAIRTYTVTRTQEIEVRSTSPQNAMVAGVSYFDELAVSTDIGHVTPASMKIRELSAKEH